MFLVNRAEKNKVCLPFVFSRLAIAFVVLNFFFYSPAAAQCVIPLLNNAISLKPAVCTGTVGYLQGTTPTGGSGTYTYQWQVSTNNCTSAYANITGATTIDYMIPATDAVGNCYRRVVTSGSGCTSTSGNIKVDAADRTTPSAPTVITVQPTCVLNTGTITITSPAPASGINYSVNGTTYTNSTGIFALPPGTYSVTAKFSTGCVSPALSVTLNAPSATSTVSPATATICTNGSQVLTATAGGTLYQWYRGTTMVASSPTDNTYTVSGAQPGTYYAIITNGLCTTQTNNAVITAVAPPSGSITPAGPINICSDNSTTLTATGGGTYLWYRNGNLISNTTPTLTTNLGGTYSVILNNGVCSTQIANTVQVNIQAVPTGTISPESASICFGSSQPLSVSGGASYQWYLGGVGLTGDTSATYSASQAGTYTVDIISSFGCKAKATNSSTITVTPLPSGSISPASATLCSNDSVALTATGGVSYQWYIDGQSQSGFFASTFNAKVPGRYAVEIFDTRGCKGKSSNESIVTLSTLQTSVASTNITCTQSSGTVTATGSGGTGPYQYKLDAGAYSSTSSFPGLSAGNHKVTVKDAAGCTSETAFTIIQVQSTLAATSSITNATCGQPNGVIAIQPTGGTGPYTFSLNSGNFQNTNSFSGLAVGVYKITVKDGVGCTYEVSAEVKQLVAVPNLVVTNPAKICPGTTADLKAGAVTVGSDAGLTLTYWKDAAAVSPVANPSAVTEGTYYIRAANSACFSIKPVVVTVQTVFPGSITYTRTTACITDSLPLTASGGVSFRWFRNDTLITGANKVTYQAKQSGVYSVSISDGTCFVKASNTVQIEFKACTPIFDPRIFVPTGFTPNRNGTNDVLRPIFYNIATLHYFKVYNRWGQQVFETATAGKGWDGTKDGIPQPPETYSWILECVGKNGEIIKQSGRSALIR